MMNVLAAAAVALAATPPASPASAADIAEPAMFMVRDADTTVYIFGTFHALDGQADWFNNEVKSAFDSSGELVLETIIPDASHPAYPAFGSRPFRAPSVTPSASFLATTRMAINAGRTQGMSVGNGADMVLRRAADTSGKYVEGLETLESQLTMFSRMPQATAGPPKPATPAPAPVPNDGLSKAMFAMQSAWKRGEQRFFAQMLDQLRQSSPATYRMMFTERNSRWADWVAARMQTPGTVFVAVGAGHLAGNDSLLVRLAEMGIESARVN